MKLGLRLVGASLSLLAPSVGLYCQTLPVPTLPPEVEDASLARPRPLAYETGIGARWDSNIDFETPDGPSGVAIVPHAALTRLFRSPRGELRVEAAGRWVGYVEGGERSRGYGEISLEGRHSSSPSTEWKGAASYSLGYADSAQPLREQGVLLPLVRTHTLVGELGVSRQMGARTSLQIGGRIYRVDFDAPELLTGQSLRGTVGLDRRLGARSTVAVVYALEQTLAASAGASYLTHFGSFQWKRVLSPRAALLLEAGAGYAPDAQAAGLSRKESFFGGASLRRQVRRSSLTVFVRREVAPVFGSGVSRLEIRAGLNADVPLGRRWKARLDAVHVRPDERVGPFASSDEALVALGRTLGRRLEIAGEASYRRLGASAVLPALDAFQAGIFVTLGSPRR